MSSIQHASSDSRKVGLTLRAEDRGYIQQITVTVRLLDPLATNRIRVDLRVRFFDYW